MCVCACVCARDVCDVVLTPFIRSSTDNTGCYLQGNETSITLYEYKRFYKQFSLTSKEFNKKIKNCKFISH